MPDVSLLAQVKELSAFAAVLAAFLWGQWKINGRLEQVATLLAQLHDSVQDLKEKQ